MLDKETKRIIDNARDILVGKVPNPLSQVDLITIAMIYKFMDDMDLDNISLGGKRLFFTGDYEKYAWSNLLSSTVGNNERLNTYAEALDKLPYAKNIPQLFRTIFKDAFLPFRDGATLTMFLKEINNLSYENSENLGDAFEYLLSIMSSQGDAGQFRTPRHIIDFIVEVVNPTKTDSILDPACGTAGFLISAYKHILQQAKSNIVPLSVDEIKNITQNIEGYDIDPTMVKLSLVNLYLHRFSTPRIYEYDTLSSDDRWGDKFDVILANPPFMTPKGGIRPHNKFGIKANRAEVLFVDYFMEHLTLKGKAGFVVPEGIIFQSATAYKSLRKMMVDDYFLYAVVSLPAGVFNPYSGVKTSILFFDRELAKKTDKILFVDIKNDGYDLGAQRRPIKDNDLPSALDAVKKYQTSYNSPDLELPSNCLLVEKSKIAENGEYNLTASRYKQTQDLTNSKWKMVKLGDLVEVKNGYAFKSEMYVSEGHRVMRITNVQKGYLVDSDPKFYSYSETLKQYDLKEQDILLSLTGNVGRVGIMTKDLLPAYLNQRVACLRIKRNTILEKFLFFILNTDAFEKLCIDNSNGIAQKNLSTEFVKQIEIPLPPLEVQEEVVKELDGYQAIIDGAQKVVDNWKPTFTINPNWGKVKLGDVADFIRGPFGGALKKEIFKETGYLVYEQYHAINNDFNFGRYFIDKEKYQEMKRFSVNAGDLIISCSGTMGRIAIIPDIYKDGIINQALLKLTTHNQLNNRYLKILLQQPFYQDKYFSNQAGVAIQNVMSVKELKNISIPLPSLEEQKSIVAKIEQEEQYVDACKKLIELNKQKISDKIKSIWNNDKE